MLNITSKLDIFLRKSDLLIYSYTSRHFAARVTINLTLFHLNLMLTMVCTLHALMHQFILHNLHTTVRWQPQRFKNTA